jgi:hypothetical protein
MAYAAHQFISRYSLAVRPHLASRCNIGYVDDRTLVSELDRTTHQATGLSQRPSHCRSPTTIMNIEIHVAEYWKCVEAYAGYSWSLVHGGQQRWRMNASVATPHAYSRAKPEIPD